MNKKIIYFTCFLLLLSPQLVFCEEGNNSTEEQTEDLIEYILGEYNHLFEIVGFVHTHECHELCNLSGSNVALGIWESSENNTIDAQVDDSRSELAGRIHIMDNYPTFSEHATTVALIIGSKTDEKADLGMAPAIEIYSYDIDSYYTEIVNSGVDISTNSWGNNNKSLLGNYTSSSSYDFDNAIRNNDIICFKSAGNENDGNLYNTITPPGTAKNIITVGAATEDLFSDTAYFSSFGPCDDGRIKPEIVAPGYNIFLGVVEYYNSIQGTSYACPVASGSAALVLEKWKLTHSAEDMLPSTMKALLVHTANNDGNGPTYRYGYGMLDTKEAVDLVELDTTETLTIVQDYSSFPSLICTNQTTYEVPVPENTGELKVTLAWSDTEGSKLIGTQDLFNDLDLVVSRDDGASNEYYYPWVLDPDNEENSATCVSSSSYDPQNNGDHLNPLEQVQIKNPEAGTYSVVVEGDLRYGPQNYSLVITVKPKVEVYSDKEGAKVYVNNEDCYGLADGVIQNGVAEVCAYAGENSILVEQSSWWSFLFPKSLNIDCTVSKGDAQRYYAYFDSYTLELKDGLQVVSLPFNVSVSDILPPSGAEVKIFEDGSFITMSSSDVLEKGYSYLVISNQDATINLDAESNTFEKIDLAVGSHFIGAPAASCQVSDLVGDLDGKMVYKYNQTSDSFVQAIANETVSPGEALFVCSMEASEVNV